MHLPFIRKENALVADPGVRPTPLARGILFELPAETVAKGSAELRVNALLKLKAHE